MKRKWKTDLKNKYHAEKVAKLLIERQEILQERIETKNELLQILDGNNLVTEKVNELASEQIKLTKELEEKEEEIFNEIKQID